MSDDTGSSEVRTLILITGSLNSLSQARKNQCLKSGELLQEALFPRFLEKNDADYTTADSELLDFLDFLSCLDELLKL
jgi:hypothetical protein